MTTPLADPPRRDAALVFGVMLLAALAFAWSVAYRSDPVSGAARIPLWGDEPHYLLIAWSLATDGDSNVADDRYTDLAFLPIYAPSRITHHAPAGPPDAPIYSRHDIGLPLLLAPILRLVPRDDPALARIGLLAPMALCSALLVLNLFWLLSAQAAGRVVPLLLTGLMSISLPLVIYSGQLYSDLPAALALVYTLRRVERVAARGGTCGRLLLDGVVLGSLAWFHVKYALATVVLGLYVVWKLGREPGGWRRVVSLLAPTAALGGLLAWRYHSCFGSVVPTAAWDGEHTLTVHGVGLHFVGMLMDRSHGMLLFTPHLLLGVVGLVGLAPRRPALATLALALLGATVGLNVLHFRWWGGYCPPGRYLLPGLFAFAIGLQHLALHGSWLSRGLVLVTAAVGLAASAALLQVTRDGFPYLVWGRGEWGLAARWGLDRWLPDVRSVQLTPPVNGLPSAIWLGGAGLVGLLGGLAAWEARRSRRQASAASRSSGD